ncbi:two-component system sensor histidine kinase [Campylobacter showae]|uniref:histidine kinase n=1 Tax=Campylobacter showae RM3277 TaxID=553219 RepID=C6RGC9_9BACT|nr:ArsS family sensor histidine kinase [Campylobacter showae]EET79479.1 HAMP domain protein [Campylobacter showae RM3277]QCD49077.1 two-component system sensor histidine kinase [Campylobacter showae]
MKRSSVFYTITFIFALALTSIFLAFLWLMDYDKQNYARELNAKYSTIARNQLFLMSGIINEKEYERQTGDFKIPEITNEQQKEEILANATVLEEISADIGSSAIMIYQNHHYLKVQHVDKILLLKDNDYQPYRYDIIKIIFLLVAIILLAAYVFVIRKLKPLRKLKRQIAKFAAGEIEEVQNVSSGNDEISEVAEAFYDAVSQIKSLNASRKLFLRNIMHELKTPITKGRLAAEMIEKSKNQERLVSVFIKLENLINEFAAVEQVTSNIALNNTKICRIDDVIDEALDIAMVDPGQVTISKLEDVNLNADFKLLAIAAKNMIDNALKYSPNKHVNITITRESIKFINEGERLSKELCHYVEPFTKGESAQKSFGLGLYIVENIIKAHKLTLSYEYKNGLNVFSFENLQNIAA